MRAVAERLVLRRSAAANGHVVASFILMTIRRGQRHAAAQPDRAAAVFHRILDQSDRERRIRFDGLARNLVEGKQPPGRAFVDLAQEHRPYVGIVGARDLRPDLAVRVAKARVGAQVPRVQQRKIGTVENPRLLGKGRARRGFGPVKADFRMGAIAKWRLGRLAAAAECVFGRSVISPAPLPFYGFALGIGADDFFGERRIARDDVRPILGDDDGNLRFDIVIGRSLGWMRN
jgi:hypothetical protein